MTNEESITVDQALSVIRRDHFDDVRGIAEEVTRAVKDGEVDEDGFYDYIHEQCDNSQRVIYTFQAKLGMLCTNHDSAYQDELGEPAATVEAAMYMALIADVTALLGSFDDIKEELEENAGTGT